MIAVLYVDDEPALLELGKRFLERAGQLAVDTLPSAHEALMVMGEKEYDAIVSDYLMPGMNGIEFLAEIRASGNSIPFIIFTGRGREDVIIEAINTGVNFYIQKGGDPSSQFAELEHKILQAVQQRRAEMRIRDYERREAEILNFLPDATLAIDTRGVVIAWNRAMEEMTGVPAEAMLGKGDYEYALPFYGNRRPILIDLIFSDPEEIRTKYAGIVRDGTTLAAETSLPRLRGKQRTLWGKASLLFNQSGTVIGAIEVIRDLTGRKQVEETLRASESRLRYMLGFSEMADRREHELLAYAIEGAGQVTGSLLGYLAFVNDKETELRMYAWSMAAMKECSLQEKPLIYPLEKTGLWGEAVRQRRPVITNDYAAPNPAKKGYPDGHPPVIRHMNIPVFDGDRIVIVAGVANKPADYTDDDVRQLTLLMQGLWQVLKRRRAEDELRAANEQLTASDEELRSQLDEVARAQEERARTGQNFRLLVENAPDAIYIQTGGRFVYLNQAALRLLGASSAGDLLGSDIYDRIHSSFHEVVRERVRTLTADVDPVPPLEEVYVKLDGSPIDVEVTAVPVMYEGEGGVLVMLRDITGRKWAERALRESESKYRELAEMLPQIVFEMDGNSTITFVNRQAFPLLGYTEEDMTSDFNALTVIHPSHQARARENLRKSVTGEPFEHLEYTLVRKDGSTFPAFVYVAPVFQGRDLAGFRGIIVDITERKAALDALRGSEATLESIFRAAPVGIGLVRDRVLLRVNDRITEMTGYAPEELVGKSARILYPDDEEFALVGREKYEQIRERGTGTVETRWKRKDGSIRDILLSSTPLDSGDPARGVTFTALDITDRKRAEEALRESEEKYRALIELAPDAVLVHRDGKVMFANPECIRLAGVGSVDDLIGRDLLPFVHPDDRQSALDQLRQLGEGRFVPLQEMRLLKADGQPFTVDITGRPIMYQGLLSVLTVFRDITAKKQAEEALRGSEEKYRALVETTIDFIWETDAAGVYTYASPQIRGMLGYEPDELIGRTPFDLMPPDEAERVGAAFRQYMEAHLPIVTIENRNVRRDGSEAIFETSAVPRFGRDGSFEGYRGIDRDITGRKQAEEALRAKSEEVERFFTTSIDLFCIADTDGYFRRLNPEWEKTLGYPLVDLEGRRFLDFVHPDDLQETLAAIADLGGQKEVFNFTNRYRHRDGTYRWIEWRSFPKGSTIYAAARDITWRKEMEEALRESEERYRSVIENIEDGFIRTDRDGRLVMASPSVARLTGYASADDLTGQPVVSIYRSPEARVNLLEEMKKTGNVRDYEIEFRRRDGSLFWGAISAHFLYDEAGAVSGTEAVIRDITQRKNMENALRLANRKLLLLASTTRHDMVNQITVLQGYLALSRDRLADPEALLGCIDREEQAAACISSLLQFMKEYEQIGIHAPVWGEIRGLVEATAGQVVPGNITVECMVPAGYDVLADPLIARVFYNLMENAIRHGGSIMTIRFSVEDMGGTSCIVCEDDGSGIPAGEKEKIFEQGFGKGTGLGLFLSREILAITGITIRETGEPGRGARFEITVPDGAWRVRDAPEPDAAA